MQDQMPLASLDHLRSTRTRVAKPVSRPAPSRAAKPSGSHDGSSSSSEPSLRDWSRHFGARHPLRVVFVGHNPSTGSWDTVAPYAHGSNRFWGLLRAAKLVTPGELCAPEHHAQLPAVAGVGFIDLFVAEGSDASKVRPDAAADPQWRAEFLQRFANATGGVPPRVVCCVSKIVAKKLMPEWARGQTLYGPAGKASRWQLQGLGDAEVWVLPSTSGRVGLTKEQRLTPFLALADRMAQLPPWGEEKEDEREEVRTAPDLEAAEAEERIA